MTACGHHADTNAALCPGCATQLRRRLAAIPDLYWALELDIVQATPPPAERAAGGKAAPLPVPAETLDVLILRLDHGRLDGLESLEGWCRTVMEDRRLAWPDYPPITYFGRLSTACGFLALHWAWIVGQSWSDELADEVEQIHRTLKHAVEPNGRWQRTRLPCPTQGCDGTLWRDQLDPGSPAIVCRQCEARWESEAWQLLADQLQTPVTIKDALAFAVWLKEDTVRKWIDRGIINDHGRAGAPRVLLADVMAAWQRREVSA